MPFDWRYGERQLQRYPLDKDSADITVGMALTHSGATSGYLKEVDASGEAVVGIAASEVVVTGSADGDHYVMVDTSLTSVYEVGPDAGSVTQALLSKTCDVGADGKTLNIDASATDDLQIVQVDLTNNKMLCRLLRNALGAVA